MKKELAISLFVLFFFTLGNIRFLDDSPAPNEEMFLHVNVINDNPFDLHDVSVRVFSLDLDLDLHGADFDLDSRDSGSQIFTWSAEPRNKECWLRIVATDDDNHRSVKHRSYRC